MRMYEHIKGIRKSNISILEEFQAILLEAFIQGCQEGSVVGIAEEWQDSL
jgi:hypothetical protein